MQGSSLVTETRTLVYPKGLINPEDLVTFSRLPGFLQEWSDFGLSAEEMKVFEVILMTNPKQGKVVRGSGGLRKISLNGAFLDSTKGDKVRIGYAYSESSSVIILVNVSSMHARPNDPRADRREMRRLLAACWHRILQ
jgi:hypothetical protein